MFLVCYNFAPIYGVTAVCIAHLTGGKHVILFGQGEQINDTPATVFPIKCTKAEVVELYNYNDTNEGCTNFVQKGGVCIKHGAKRKRCNIEGCKNQVQKRGMCRRHGAYRSP